LPCFRAFKPYYRSTLLGPRRDLNPSDDTHLPIANIHDQFSDALSSNTIIWKQTRSWWNLNGPRPLKTVRYDLSLSSAHKVANYLYRQLSDQYLKSMTKYLITNAFSCHHLALILYAIHISELWPSYTAIAVHCRVGKRT